MKKLFIAAAIMFAASTSTFAQDDAAAKPFTFSVGVDAQFPMGDAGDFYKFGIGGSVQGDYNIDESLAITLSAGYLSMSAKEYDEPYVIFDPVTGFPTGVGTRKVTPDALGLIPVLAGIKYSFTPMIYASGQLGMTFASGSGSGSNFTYAPGVGFRFSKFDVLAKYTGMSAKGGGNFNTIGLRLAYNF